jgi:hypothetical protein
MSRHELGEGALISTCYKAGEKIRVGCIVPIELWHTPSRTVSVSLK